MKEGWNIKTLESSVETRAETDEYLDITVAIWTEFVESQIITIGVFNSTLDWLSLETYPIEKDARGFTGFGFGGIGIAYHLLY